MRVRVRVPVLLEEPQSKRRQPERQHPEQRDPQWARVRLRKLGGVRVGIRRSRQTIVAKLWVMPRALLQQFLMRHRAHSRQREHYRAQWTRARLLELPLGHQCSEAREIRRQPEGVHFARVGLTMIARTRLGVRCLDCGDELRHHCEDVAHNAEVGNLEDGSGLILVDGDDGL